MRNITEIPTLELKKDLQESLVDIELCQNALLCGVTVYSGGSVQVRLNTNKRFVEVITAELKRREKVYEYI